MRPGSPEEAAELLADLSRDGRSVRVLGRRTKRDWSPQAAEIEVETGALKRIIEHNRGDFTAVLEAGLPLRDAQEAFAEADQMLAWDPPIYPGGPRPASEPGPAGGGAGGAGGEGSASIGGIVATADSGPGRHRYGGVRDTLIGITVILSDGTVARAGGKVIKNVAGYDLSKLFAGSFGTLGMIATVSVRLHPLARESATVIGSSEQPERIAAVAADLARRPLEAECLDICWTEQTGQVLIRFAGALAERRAQETARELALEQVRVVEEDGPVWERQRSLQRSPEGAVLKVSARPSELVEVLRAAAAARSTVVARAALGLAWVAFDPGEDLLERVETFTRALAPRACAPLDGAVRYGIPPAAASPGVIALMDRIKARFDPAGSFPSGPSAAGGSA